MKITAWFKLFRIPNLPTAPGDALAGAAVAHALGDGEISSALAAGASALCFYMFGLADNDIVGACGEEDKSAQRPIPCGEISLRAAGFARICCLAFALGIGAVLSLPLMWWLAAGAIVVSVVAYNRLKNKWLMGLCRAFSVFSGAAAMQASGLQWRDSLCAAGVMAIGWMFYVASLTKISEGEGVDSDGLGVHRYFYGLSALIPLAAVMFFKEPRMWVMPVLGCMWAFASWCVNVFPLGDAHTSMLRRMTVGRLVSTILYLQIGFMMIVPIDAFVFCAVLQWLALRLVKRITPTITGS